MGDVVSLIEQVQATTDHEKPAKLAAKLTKAGLRLHGPARAARRVQPHGRHAGAGVQAAQPGLPPGALAQVDDKMIRRQLGIIDSMTPGERRRPVIAASRKRRIAAGAGVPVQEVNRLLKQFMQMEKVMKKMKAAGSGS